MPDLTQIVKAYDVRGVVPDQWDETLAELFGAAFVQVTGADAIVVGHDMRPSSPGLSAGLRRAAPPPAAPTSPRSASARPTSCTSPRGHLDLPGAMFTASHNPAQYNGIKMCRAGAAPVGQDTGLAEIRALVEELAGPTAPPATGADPGHRRPSTTCSPTTPPTCAPWSTSPASARSRSSSTPATAWAATPSRPCFDGLPLDLVPMYFELDGTFPNHEANPLDPKNLVDLQAKVRETGADLGLAFDGDADRCFVVDERGEPRLAVRDHRPGRRPRAGQAPRRHGHPQPDHLLVGARGRPRARRRAGAHPRRPLLHQAGDGPHRRRSSAASTPRTTTSATSGTPTPACSPPCTCSPPSASRTARSPSWSPQYDRYAASGEINSHGRRPGRPHRRGPRRLRRPPGRHLRRARRPDRHRATTGGSTCAPPTPSRCCASTSRPRDAGDHGERVRDEVLALVRG